MADIPSIGTKGRTVFAVAGSTIGSLVDGDIGGGTNNNGRAVEHLQNTLGMSHPGLRTNGMRGRLDHHYERFRYGVRNVGGRVVLAPSPTELSNLKALIFGTAGALTDFGGLEFDAFVDRDQRRFVYTGCKITRAEFRSATGGMLTLSLDIVAKQEANVATALPSLAIPSQAPMMHHDSATLVKLSPTSGPVTIKPAELMWAINHVAKEDCYYNSITRTVIPIVDRVIDVLAVIPYTDDVIAAALHEMPWGGITDGGLDVGYTNADVGTIGFSMRFPKVQWSRQSPADDGRTEMFLTLAGQGFAASDSTRPVTNQTYTLA